MTCPAPPRSCRGAAPVSSGGNRPFGTNLKSTPVSDQDQDREDERQRPVAHDPAQAALVGVRAPPRKRARSKAVQLARAPPSGAGLRNRLHSIGVSVSDTKPETRIDTMIVTANSLNSLPMMPAHEQQRNEHRRQRQRHREDREADFLGALERRLHAVSLPSRCGGRCSRASRSRRRRRSRRRASAPSATGCRC